LREQDGRLERLIHAVHLSRPENHLSIYQSGCNFACRKCHSAKFSQRVTGRWYTVEDLVEICRDYERAVTLVEPRPKATSWYAGETCLCCGCCVAGEPRPATCPGVVEPKQIVLSAQARARRTTTRLLDADILPGQAAAADDAQLNSTNVICVPRRG